MDFDASLEALIQKWSEATEGKDPLALRVPLGPYLNEANELAVLIDKHLEPLTERGVEYPGLSQVIDDRTLTWETATEIRELVFVVGEMQARALSERKTLHKGQLVAARKLRSEWMAALRFLFESQNDTEKLSTLRHMRRDFKDQSQRALCESLLTIASLAHDHMDALRAIGMTDDKLESCRRTHDELVERRSERVDVQMERSHALNIRNLLLALLDTRVQAARRAFRFVFRDHEDVLKRTQSEYARVRRRKHTARKKLI